MKNKIVISMVMLVLLVAGFGIFKITTNRPGGEIPSANESHDNLEMENELRGVLNEVILEQRQKGIELSIESINTYGDHQGYVKMGCEEPNFVAEEKFVGDFVERLVKKYPEKYGENGRLWLDVETCSEVRGSDGRTTFVNPSVWQVGSGGYGLRI